MRDRRGLWARHAAELRLRDASDCTLKARRSVLERLSAHADLAKVTEADVLVFLANPRFSASTRRTYAAHLRSFYRWAVKRGGLRTNPADDLPRMRVNGGVPNPIDRGALARAIAEADPRMRLWLMLAAYAGLRCCEIAALRGESVRGTMLVVVGKGNKERAVPLHPLLRVELDTWPRTGWLVPAKDGDHVRASYVSDRVNRYLRDKGIGWTAHKLRHRFATDALAHGGNLRTVQELLGHASPVTTQVYTQVEPREAAAVVAQLSYVL